LENKERSSDESPAFIISLILCAILFILFLRELPFPEHYRFWALAGIFAVSGYGAVMFFFGASRLINIIYKMIIEVLVAIFLFLNACYVAFCWAMMDFIKMRMDIESTFAAILVLALLLFIADLIIVVLLLPFARIAKSDLLDG